MNLRHLRTFVEIVECGGIHRAAARLHLSQPAASRQIHGLEAELGVSLFDRIGRRVRLTSEGEDLLRRGRRLLAEAESFTQRATALKKGETGILRVGATPQVMENVLAVFLRHYRHEHPGVEVRLVEAGGNDLPTRLDHGDIHLALMAVDDERFRWRPLFPVCDLAVMPQRHRFARRRTLDVSELAEEPLLLLRGGFASRDWFDDACRIARARPRILLESGAPHTAIALAGEGYGVAVVPSTVVIPRDRVQAAPLMQRGVALAKWLRVAWEPQRSLALHAERFVDELVAYCGRHHPGREFTRRLPLLPRQKLGAMQG